MVEISLVDGIPIVETSDLPRHNKTEQHQFSGVTIVIFIALGVLVFVLLFIFGKRQIMRFALRSRRGPHVPIGHSAPRWLRKEIERRLDLISHVKFEPKLITEGSEPVKYEQLKARMEAMDHTKSLELQLRTADPKVTKLPGENLRTFLMSQLAGILKGCQPKTIHHLCDLYERARYSPEGFSTVQLETYQELLTHVGQLAQNNKNNMVNASPKPSFISKSKKKKESETTAL